MPSTHAESPSEGRPKASPASPLEEYSHPGTQEQKLELAERKHLPGAASRTPQAPAIDARRVLARSSWSCQANQRSRGMGTHHGNLRSQLGAWVGLHMGKVKK